MTTEGIFWTVHIYESNFDIFQAGKLVFLYNEDYAFFSLYTEYNLFGSCSTSQFLIWEEIYLFVIIKHPFVCRSGAGIPCSPHKRAHMGIQVRNPLP